MLTTPERNRMHDPSVSGHDIPAGPRKTPSERVQLATSLLTTSLDACISVDGVAEASGLSTRSLYRLIQSTLGTSPVALRRRARMASAREELSAPGPDTTVTATALRWGFTHLGRFSRDYARTFGELPSRTLSLARTRRSPQDAAVEPSLAARQ
jgi:transcriptional regulator GlxA family with amidase domain